MPTASVSMPLASSLDAARQQDGLPTGVIGEPQLRAEPLRVEVGARPQEGPHKSAEQRGMPGKIINFIEALSLATVSKVAVDGCRAGQQARGLGGGTFGVQVGAPNAEKG